MNMPQDLNLFPSKSGVSDHYIPHMILSQKSWDYNKHFQVELIDGVQTKTSLFLHAIKFEWTKKSQINYLNQFIFHFNI